MLEFLHDRERYATLDGDAVAVLCDLVAERGVVPAEFSLAKVERYECGGAAHWMAIYRHGMTGLDFALIPGGTFMMGSPSNEADRFDDESQHQVTITKPFLMCVTACTQAAWSRVSGGKNPSNWRGDELPVEEVSWRHVNDWCKKAGLSLPTEAQWEYGCRAGTTAPFCFGDSLDTSMANIVGGDPYDGGAEGESRGETTPVRSFKPNAFGLYDVHGNVWEWCADWYEGDLGADAVRDPAGPATGSDRVSRGGSWFDYASFCRAADRDWYVPGSRYLGVGFRPARPLL